MSKFVYDIPIPNLLIALSLMLIVVAIYAKWSLDLKKLLYATFRMLLQLVLIGFALTFLFEHDEALIVCGVLSVMFLIAGWIALTPVAGKRTALYGKALIALLVGCVPVLVVVVAFVIPLTPWHQMRYIIPLAGMIFANAMNILSLSAERFQTETDRNVPFEKARATAFQTGLIPMINSFFAVGLVALPGMMTGQILAGISPLVAVRYQIVVMCMLFSASGIASATYLTLQRGQSPTRVDLRV